MKANVVICDIDGTLTIENHALRNPFDWARVSIDSPNPPIVYLVNSFIDAGIEIVFVTGRSEECREDTLTWLADHLWLKRENIELYMRSKDDYRKGHEVKRDIYRENIEGKCTILFSLEDKPSLVEMWCDLGLMCLQVNEGEDV